MEDEQKVSALYHELLQSWNRGDADAFANLFDAEGFVIGFDGTMHEGPDRIREDLNEILANQPIGQYVGKIRSVMWPAAGVALLRAVAGMSAPGESTLNPGATAVQTLLAVRRDDSWRILAFQNTPAAFHGRPQLAVELTNELEVALSLQTTGA